MFLHQFCVVFVVIFVIDRMENADVHMTINVTVWNRCCHDQNATIGYPVVCNISKPNLSFFYCAPEYNSSVECVKPYYGRLCDTFCVSSPRYTCSDDGQTKCKSNFHGEQCLPTSFEAPFIVFIVLFILCLTGAILSILYLFHQTRKKEVKNQALKEMRAVYEDYLKIQNTALRNEYVLQNSVPRQRAKPPLEEQLSLEDRYLSLRPESFDYTGFSEATEASHSYITISNDRAHSSYADVQNAINQFVHSNQGPQAKNATTNETTLF